MIATITPRFWTTMMFWVASRACKAIKTKVISIWRALGAFYKETSLTNILQNNNICHYPRILDHHVVLGGLQGLQSHQD